MNNLIKIFPALELNPWRPDMGVEISNENYNQFKNRILKKHGLSKNPFLENSLMISDLDGDDLKGVIKIELFDYIEDGLNSNDIYSFDGGFVMQIDKNKLFSHSVGTGKLSHYKNWFRFLKSNPTNWEEIWIGRPWIYGRIKEGKIQLTNYHDETIPLPKNDDSEILYQFDLDKFNHEINKAKLIINGFRRRIEESLKKENNKDWYEISESLIEN